MPDDQPQTADQMLGRDVLIKIHALGIAASHRREIFALHRKEGEGEYDGALGREVLADAQIYAAWLTAGEG